MAQGQERSDIGGGSVLRRKTDSGRALHQARAMTLAKALRLGLAKTGDDLMGLTLAALSIRVEEVAGDALETCFDGEYLLMLLDGPGGRPAAAALDPQLVGALIQQETMGQVLPDLGGPPRAMTNTDAAVTAPFVDGMISRAACLPDDAQERQLIEGHRFGSRVDTPRLLSLALEEPRYRMIRIAVDIAGGVRQGHMLLCLPLPEEAPVTGTVDTTSDAGSNPAARPRTLGDGALLLNVDLTVALARLRLPLARLSALRVGELLPLDSARFDLAEVLSPAGGRLVRGVLGQIDGCRALRIVPEETGGVVPHRRATDREAAGQPDPVPLGGAPAPQGDALWESSDTLAEASVMPDLSDLPELTLTDPEDPLPFDGLAEAQGLPERKAG
ncbi:hypothetical protein BOO69_10780 [Sulfitobacter alexandrii]|uniref:Flagellar motor switch protein FliN-like C-terminal domain-containing protein n=1 Tax=Sulfitobacter alexandrii TaxID=1917485 RepID=A0A1J0WHN2_9RHOB|nr:FliM/FliN family flagellar motor C-terminal domain-containing protein [Sulfitobacter alexandrii]APE43844.1 hypothetical protein BOO69_10780 [Sulfitobacter alexandrii]